MNSAIILTLIAAFLWAITNHIDDFLVNYLNKSDSNIKTLLIFSTLFVGLIFSPIWLVLSKFKITISLLSLIFIFLASLIYTLGTYFYYKAFKKMSSWAVVIILQLIPVFSYIISCLLFKEILTLKQLIGSLIIILSCIIICFDYKEKIKIKGLFLMILASFLYSIYFILFDVATRYSTFNACAFWYQIGFLLIGLILFCKNNFRNAFIDAIKINGKKYFSLNICNEILNLAANLLVNFANLVLPIAIVNVLSGFQVVFAFIISLVLIKVLPKFFYKDLSFKIILQKASCIILSLVGLILLFI